MHAAATATTPGIFVRPCVVPSVHTDPGRSATSVFTSNVHPDRRGVATRCARLAAKMSTAVMPAMPNAAPANVERTGTEVSPLPAWSAMRRPLVAAGAMPARAAVSTTGEVRRARVARSAENAAVARQAATNATASTTAAAIAIPTASTSQSAWRPTSGSALRATPIGNSGDIATAPRPASTAPPIAMSPACDPTAASRCVRVRSQRSQRRLVDGGSRNVACQHDADRDETRERGHAREDPQRQRQHVDRVAARPRSRSRAAAPGTSGPSPRACAWP